MLALMGAIWFFRRTRTAIDVLRDPGTAFVDRFKKIGRPVILPNAGYASLTGPGETATPGLLTQAGGLYIHDAAGDGVEFTAAGPIILQETGTGGITLLNGAPGTAGIVLADSSAGGVGLSSDAGDISIETLTGAIYFQSGATGSAQVQTDPSFPLGFYGSTPITQPTVTGSRGGNAALASLLTALASLGLIVDSSTP